MKKTTRIHPVIAQMLADKERIEKQLQTGKPLADIGIKIVSPIAVPAEPAR